MDVVQVAGQGERGQLARKIRVVVGEDREAPDAGGRHEALQDGRADRGPGWQAEQLVRGDCGLDPLGDAQIVGVLEQAS